MSVCVCVCVCVCVHLYVCVCLCIFLFVFFTKMNLVDILKETIISTLFYFCFTTWSCEISSSSSMLHFGQRNETGVPINSIPSEVTISFNANFAP